MSLKKNLTAGFASSAWSALVSLAAVPLYIKLLGAEAYGLIGFFATSQALLQVLDLGLTPTISREVARAIAKSEIKSIGNLVKSTVTIYWLIAALIFASFFFLSAPIANYWIKNSAISDKEVQVAIQIIGLVLALKWPTAIYSGILMGAELQSKISLINIIFVAINTGGAIACLYLVKPNVHIFFIWQAITTIFFTLIFRHHAWKVVGKSKEFNFKKESLTKILNFTAGVNGSAITGTALVQTDKVILSRLLPLESFGHYMLAIQIANAAFLILTPVFNVIYPKISGLLASQNYNELIKFYRNGTRLLLVPLTIATIFVGFNSIDLVFLWTGKTALANEVGPIITLLLIGTTLNGAMHFPYALQLANGTPSISLKINCILMAIMLPLVYFLATYYGALGGGLGWAILNTIYLFIGTYFTHKVILKGLALPWLFMDVIAPISLIILILMPPFYFLNKAGLTPAQHLITSLVLVIVFGVSLIYVFKTILGRKMLNLRTIDFDC